jgi:uncharacterized protein YbjQ (UPF0145 family)
MVFELSVGAVLMATAVALYLHGRSDGKTSISKNGASGDVSDMLVTYSKFIPGHEVKRVFGYVESSSVLPKGSSYSPKLAEDATINKLMVKAKELGANAILDLQIEKEEFAVHIRIVAKGLAVKV